MLQRLHPIRRLTLLCLLAAGLCCCGKPGGPAAEPQLPLPSGTPSSPTPGYPPTPGTGTPGTGHPPAPGTGTPPEPGTGTPPAAGNTYFDATVNDRPFAAAVFDWYYKEAGVVNIEGRTAAGDQLIITIHMGPQLKWGTFAWYMERAYKLAQMTYQPAADFMYLSGYKNCAGIPVYSAGSAGITRLDTEGGQTVLTGDFSATVYETGHCSPATSKKITGVFRVRPRGV